jgi:hypothetical protein
VVVVGAKMWFVMDAVDMVALIETQQVGCINPDCKPVY